MRALVFLIAAGSMAAGAEAPQWLAAKFLGQPDTRPLPAHILVYNRTGSIHKNSIRGTRFRIAGRQFDRGINMPYPGEIAVHLPAPGAGFEAVVGVDSNDLGYYSNAGRGSVVASVEAGGKELFRSPVMREGMEGVPVTAALNGAREFTLKLEAEGKKGLTHQAEWDQADWGDARIRLADGRVLWLADLPVGPLAGPYTTELPFSFRYGGQPSAELLKTWVFRRQSQGAAHTLTWTDPRTGLEVRARVVTYPDFPVVEWTLYFRNTSSSSTPILEDIQALDTRFERNAEGEFLLHHGKGSPNSATDYQPLETPLPRKAEIRIATTGGRPTDSDLCYFNLEWPGEGVILALGWPGQWAARFMRDEGTRLAVRAGQELTYFRLLPGEEVRSPLVAVLFWKGDWLTGQNLWRRWMIAHNLPRPGGKLPPPQIAAGSNRYTIEMQEANEANQKQYLESYLKQGMPIDYWWMDAGWYPFKTGWWNTGTWFPDPARFPNGLRPIADLAHSKGVRTVVWFEPERVQPGSWLAENHPEWLLGKSGDNRLLYLGNPDAWRWLTDHVSEQIAKQGIDTYRQDFNFAPLEIWRANDAPDRQGITEIKHVTGYLAYWDELRRRFPNLLIDTCASGGRRNDLETLRRAVPLWRSDHAYEPAAMQQLTYGMALWIPYFGTAINSSDPYIFRSQMTPAVALGAEPQRRDIDGAALLRYLKQWREVSEFYYGDYFPLTPYSTRSTGWMAWQLGRPDGTAGVIQAFRRPDSPFESARFRLRGIDPAGRYAVTDLDEGALRTLAGRELMEQGLPVTLRARPGAALITYRKLAR
jgi:alpha-galactosidase